MTRKREYKKSKLQQEKSGQYKLSIPEWCIKKVLQAIKGDYINFDFKGKEVILTNGTKNQI